MVRTKAEARRLARIKKFIPGRKARRARVLDDIWTKRQVTPAIVVDDSGPRTYEEMVEDSEGYTSADDWGYYWDPNSPDKSKRFYGHNTAYGIQKTKKKTRKTVARQKKTTKKVVKKRRKTTKKKLRKPFKKWDKRRFYEPKPKRKKKRRAMPVFDDKDPYRTESE